MAKTEKTDAVKAGKDAVKAPSGGKVERPDETFYKAKLDQIETKINGAQEKKKAINAKLEAKQEGKEGYQSNRQEMINRVEAIRQSKLDKINKLKDLTKKSKENQRELKQKEKVASKVSEGDIDRQIHELNMKLQLGTMSLNEEKMTMLKIKKLKTIERPAAQKNARELEALKSTGGDDTLAGKSIEERKTELSDEIAGLEEQQKTEQELLNELKANRAKQTEGLDQMLEERKGLNDNIKALMAEKQKIRSDRDADYTAWKAYMAEQKRIREEKEKTEWAAWEAQEQAHRAQRDLDKPNPFLNDTMLLEQVIDYCKNLLGLQKKEEDKKEEKLDLSAVPADVTVLQGKRQQEGFMADLVKGKKLKQKNSNKTKSQAIKHTADTFKSFEELKMKAPMTTGEVPELLAKLEAQLEKVQVKVKAWEAERQEKLAAAKALESATASASKEAAEAAADKEE